MHRNSLRSRGQQTRPRRLRVQLATSNLPNTTPSPRHSLQSSYTSHAYCHLSFPCPARSSPVLLRDLQTAAMTVSESLWTLQQRHGPLRKSTGHPRNARSATRFPDILAAANLAASHLTAATPWDKAVSHFVCCFIEHIICS